MSKVVSINVGLPRDVPWDGKIVRTAVWKAPVRGRVNVRQLNIDGDGQGDLAGHGGEHRAVMVYQVDSYRYWAEHLERNDLEYGQFGENLTVEGLADNEVCIGDRYRIGTVVFEVTQPRVTCYRVGIRMNNPQMPSLLVAHKRPGFYFRVLEEGEIGAGDPVVQIAEGPERITVAEIDGLLYLPGHPRDRIERALRVPALSAGWKGSLKALAAIGVQGGNAGLSVSAGSPPAWTGFRSLRVVSIERESVDVLSFVLASEDGTLLPSALAGQFLAFKIKMDNQQVPLLRTYSISGSQNDGTYRISVKRALGLGSRYFHDHVQVGDVLNVSAPRGSFNLVPGSTPVVLLSAGIGATPLLSMLHALVHDGETSEREVWWCYGARNSKEHPFAREVRDLLNELPRSHTLLAYSKPDDEDALAIDYDARGHLKVELLREHGAPRTADYYLCGPATFIENITSGLKSWGVDAACIHSETFGAGPALTPGIAAAKSQLAHEPAGEKGSGPKVSFTRSGLTVPWNARFASLLEFAEACDVPVRWSCRMGVCHTCETGIIEGNVCYKPDPLDQPVEGTVLLCCAVPQSEIALDL